MGKGAFGIVFSVWIKNKPNEVELALKQINQSSLKDLSLLIIESQFHLFFTDDKIPLIKLEDIFIEHKAGKYILSLVMA